VVAVFVVRTVGQRDARVTAPSPRAVALLLDLVAGALAAGSPTDQALLSVSEAARAVAGDDVAPKGSGGENDLVRAAAPLHQTGAVIRLGAPPSKAWNALAAHPGYADAGHAGRRCATSGARLAAALQAAARNERSRGALAAKLRAERLGGWLLLPLGLCFLPAFVCLGVVPVLVGIGQTALSGTGHAS
jgi:Flp pilus assembly protein TadB